MKTNINKLRDRYGKDESELHQLIDETCQATYQDLPYIWEKVKKIIGTNVLRDKELINDVEEIFNEEIKQLLKGEEK